MHYKSDLSTWIPHHFISKSVDLLQFSLSSCSSLQRTWASCLQHREMGKLKKIHSWSLWSGMCFHRTQVGRKQSGLMPPPYCRGCVYFWISQRNCKLPEAGIIGLRGFSNHSLGFPLPSCLFWKEKSLWNTEFKLILPFYTCWIILDKPAKRYATLLRPFQQDKKGHRTFILTPISLRG